MTDFFLDSNICVYLFDKKEPDKQQKAVNLLRKLSPCISSQVLIESFLACRKKLKLPEEVCISNVLYLKGVCLLKNITGITVELAIEIKKKYKYSLLDSIIIATALLNNCSILYSEDMQHKQVIDKKLTIVNPFL